MPQLSYQTDFDQLIAGYPAEGSGKQDIISRIAEEAIEYGLGVVAGADKEAGVALADAYTARFLGVAKRVQNESGTYAVNDTVAIVTTGRVAVPVPSGVTVVAGETAYVIVADGADKGKFTNVNPTDNTNVVTGGKFVTAKKNDNLAILSLDVVA